MEPFLHPISPDLVMYHNIIKESICFDDIAAKISKRTYKTVTEFLEDMNLLFINCSTFNVVRMLFMMMFVYSKNEEYLTRTRNIFYAFSHFYDLIFIRFYSIIV